MTATVLVVEDDAGLRLAVQRILERERFVVTTAGTGRDAVTSALEHPPDVVVLDLGLPDQHGFDVMRALRRVREVPILLLTGRAATEDRVRGLERGADDYLVKPASLDELVARVRALLRRTSKPPSASIRVEALDLEVHLAGRSVTLAGAQVELTRLEFDLLVYLLWRPGIVVSRDEILARVWRSSRDFQSHAVVTEYMTRLRRKLGALPISTVRGVGYRYDAAAS